MVLTHFEWQVFSGSFMAFDGHTKKKIHDMEKFKYSTAYKVGNAIENSAE